MFYYVHALSLVLLQLTSKLVAVARSLSYLSFGFVGFYVCFWVLYNRQSFCLCLKTDFIYFRLKNLWILYFQRFFKLFTLQLNYFIYKLFYIYAILYINYFIYKMYSRYIFIQHLIYFDFIVCICHNIYQTILDL